MLRHRKASVRTGLIRRWLYIGLSLFLGYVFIFGDYGLYQYLRLLQRRNKVARELSELREQRGKLVRDLERLRKDRAFLEKVAREKYHLGRSGEKIYLLELHGDRR